ncbi:hypothetical protein GYMLUDRAFT_42224 [Collybiopsis luxurians FD-317 M1]|uniref:Uncharacterized protein n=1 Tax=Collybiopsis luxurians FD-317 M1 TaxID=944289 RepID=A0A0D0CHZ1_9AGAR|nr:hypothetical protein GYMLUDRAFT_42224 [Collybiopsis luxurians FD-317 M1]
MSATVTRTARSRKPSPSSTFDSRCSNSQQKNLAKTSSPPLNAPVRSSTSSLAGTAWDVSDQVLRTVMCLAQFTPVPYMGSIAVVAYSILSAVQGARDNQDTLKQLAYLACNTVQSVYETYEQLHGHPPPTSAAEAQSEARTFSSDPTLNAHLEELIRTLKEIDEWIKSLASRNLLRQVVASRSDLNFIQDFKDRLKQVMDNFQLQSMITLRYSMSRIAAQQKAMEQEAEQRHKSTQQTLYTIHEEVKNQNERKPPTLPQYADSPISSEPTSPFSPSPSSPPLSSLNPFFPRNQSTSNNPFHQIPPLPQYMDSLTSSESTSLQSASPSYLPYQNLSRNPFFPLNQTTTTNNNNPFAQALPSAITIQGNVIVQNILGDHHVISKVDRSKRENFGGVYHSSHEHFGLSRRLSVGGRGGRLGGVGRIGYRGSGGDLDGGYDADADVGGPGMRGGFRGDWGWGRGGRGVSAGVGFGGHEYEYGVGAGDGDGDGDRDGDGDGDRDGDGNGDRDGDGDGDRDGYGYGCNEEHALALADRYKRGSGRRRGSGLRRSRVVSEGGPAHRSSSGWGSLHDSHGTDDW